MLAGWAWKEQREEQEVIIYHIAAPNFSPWIVYKIIFSSNKKTNKAIFSGTVRMLK